jgi:1-deoxy-D-xylulose-5-phosphate reductoisomerase
LSCRLAILGSTGSVGRSTLEVVDRHPERLRVNALAAGRNVPLLLKQARRYRPRLIVLARERDLAHIRPLAAELGAELLCGTSGLTTAATHPDVDLVVSAVVGGAGLAPTVAAVRQGKRVALANKESLVMAGELLLSIARRTGAEILPLDSEHSALQQCLHGRPLDQVSRLVLTASGGPFRGCSRERLADVTPAEALEHPTWEMGRKISVDSATLVNKGLELIEACHLFQVPPDRVEVVIHPQSVVHAMVEFVDGTTLAQIGPPDMRLPIRRALSHPGTWAPPFEPLLDLAATQPLSFEPVDHQTFPSIRMARQAMELGGTAPAAFSASNEVAVDAFLEGRIPFTRIWDLIAGVLNGHPVGPADTLEAVEAASRQARQSAKRLIGQTLEQR